ncbi:MAG: TIGR03663 family protein [Candidatus Omnitrophica bacterium]|nr:TIGR03663 family protein [Candidatus Omnitrophota bacterium]
MMIKTKTQQNKVEWGLLAVGFLFLFLFLNIKPPQHDEGVNGWFIEEIISNGFYEYDPANYHGPLHHYLMTLFYILFGRNLWALRLPAVIFSFAALYLMIRFKSYLGKFTAYAGTLFVAVSPGMIFYSRYAIHESALYFFSVLALLGFFRFMTERDKISLWFLGMGITGMIVTKETFVLTLVCFALSLVTLSLYEKFSPSLETCSPPKASFTRHDVIRVVFYSVFIYVLLYSGFFLNWEGVAGVFRCFGEWFTNSFDHVAGQKGHFKPFVYWIQLFLRYEWPAFAGILACFFFLGPTPRWARLIAIYASGLLLIYSLIPYKTPWCILQLIWPFLFVTAAALQELAKSGKNMKRLAVAMTILVALLSGQKSVSLNFFHYTDDQEPYVHVQTYPEIMKITDKILKLAKRDPTKKHMTVYVVMKAYWPISWLLADFTKGLYYTENLPAKPDAGIIFCDVNRQAPLEMRLKNTYYLEKFRLNSAQAETVTYFDQKIFKDFFDEKALVFKPMIPEPPKPGEGFLVRYFTNAKWAGDPVKEEIAGLVDFAWENGERPLPAPFGILMEGDLYIPKPGEVTFYLSSDDGSDFQIDGNILLDNMGDHADRIKSGTRKFQAGWHPFRIRHYDIGGAATVRLWWKLPSAKQQKIPAKFFRPPNRKT